MRLLTRPAWLHDESAGSRKLVSMNTSRVDSPSCERVAVVTWLGGFVAGVAAGLADEQGGEPEAEAGVGDAEEERLGPQPVALRR